MKAVLIIAVIIVAIGVLLLGVYLAVDKYVNSPIDACQGYNNVKFGMSVDEAKIAAQGDDIKLVQEDDVTWIYRRLANKFPAKNFYGTTVGSEDDFLTVVYKYDPFLEQIIEIEVIHPFSNQKYKENLLKQLEIKYGKVHVTLPQDPSRSHLKETLWVGGINTGISLAEYTPSNISGVYDAPFLSVSYTDRKRLSDMLKKYEANKNTEDEIKYKVDKSKI